jgi:SAM-dependent methyltransferase
MVNTLKKPSPDWYRKIWSLDIQNMSWVEHTKDEVDFVINVLGLTGKERILDLACGVGRHAIDLAKRGYSVVGVDLTRDFIDEAKRVASREKLDTEFICADLRDVSFDNEFDVVLNMADGAIGYLENDEENLKIFDLIASALKKGGKHYMNICNAEYAETHFPMRWWEVGEKQLSLPEFHWDKETRRMLYGGWELRFGTVAERPAPESMAAHSCTRLYSVDEIKEIFKTRGMVVKKTFGGFDQSLPASPQELALHVCSQKM